MGNTLPVSSSRAAPVGPLASLPRERCPLLRPGGVGRGQAQNLSLCARKERTGNLEKRKRREGEGRRGEKRDWD